MNVPATWNELFVPAGQKKTLNQNKIKKNKLLFNQSEVPQTSKEKNSLL